MGKKSLFETASSEDASSDQALRGVESSERSELSADKQVAEGLPPGKDGSQSASADRLSQAAETSFPPIPSAGQKQSLSGGSSLFAPPMIIFGCLAFLFLLVLIASFINRDRYFIKEKNGAVEIWRGNFTPTGQDRIIILHGTEWENDGKDIYTREEVFAFARNVYLEKIQALLNDPGPPNYERIIAYVDQTLALLPETIMAANETRIEKIKQYLEEAVILSNSDDPRTLEIAQEKITAAGQALKGVTAAAPESSEVVSTGGEASFSSQTRQETHE